MGMGTQLSAKDEKPMYEAMFEAGIINQMMFSLCLGKNGGYFGIGGFNDTHHLTETKWFAMYDRVTTNYKFKLTGVSMNNHAIGGSNKWHLGFVDSGTTFSYFPSDLWDSLIFHFKHFCDEAKKTGNSKFCPGEQFLTRSDGTTVMCFEYDAKKYANKTKEFFLGYPVLNFHAQTIDGQIEKIKWFPSEYLYLEKDGDKYCFAADKGSSYEILFGSTLMR